LEFDQKYFHLHSKRQRSLPDRVMKIASFTKREGLPERTTFIFSKISLLLGGSTNKKPQQIASQSNKQFINTLNFHQLEMIYINLIHCRFFKFFCMYWNS